MFKNILKKGAALAGIFAVSAVVAFAAFSVTVAGSNGNVVSAGSANLQVTSTPISVSGLVAGGSTPNNTLTIKNTGVYSGTVNLNVTSASGALCPDLTLTVSGSASGSFAPIANGSVNLGTLAPGATLNLVQVVSLSASTTHTGTNCTWNETATLSN